MIKFFRHIRYRLMEENKTSKPASAKATAGTYLKYAIGEIILVVIGILIALQINTWNQERLDSKAEKEIIAELHTDFVQNEKILDRFLQEAEQEISAHLTLMELIGETREVLNEHNLDSLFYLSLGANELALPDNTFKNLIQSGKLSLLKDKELNTMLYDWNPLSEIRQKRLDKVDEWSNYNYVPYLLDKISFKEMDSNGNFRWSGKSKIKPDYYPLFQDIKFENYLDNTLWLHQQLYDPCVDTKDLMTKIISYTEEY